MAQAVNYCCSSLYDITQDTHAIRLVETFHTAFAVESQGRCLFIIRAEPLYFP